MHPGELLREEILPALDRPKTEIARLLGVSRQTLYDVLKERQPVTPTWRYGSGSCAETVPISGSICKSGTIYIGRSKNSERRSRKFRRWKSPESADLLSRINLICPTGKSVIRLSSPICKNIFVPARPKSLLYPPPSRPIEGRIAIVTDAGRDAVDAGSAG
jgi:DNA-binding XRE family transcriptional regulator